MALERFIILAALWPIYPLSGRSPPLRVPFLLASTLSDQSAVRRADSFSRRTRYRATSSRPWLSRWLVGSSMSRNRPSAQNSAASSTLVCSPLDKVLKLRQRTPSSTSSSPSSRSSRHRSAPGQASSNISSVIRSGRQTG